MQDLSGKAAGSWWSTGQLAGGSGGNDAMTAPGSDPAEPLEPGDAAPDVQDDRYDGRHLVRGGGPR
jgi:hypothetical protein